MGVSFNSININGDIRVKEVTVASGHGVDNASKIFPYFQSFLDTGERLVLFAAKTFTNTTDGIKYGFKKSSAALWGGTNNDPTFGRYKNGSVSEINSEASSYTATLTVGDTYNILYTVSFSKTSS